jgi:hypothetical protein
MFVHLSPAPSLIAHQLLAVLDTLVSSQMDHASSAPSQSSSSRLKAIGYTLKCLVNLNYAEKRDRNRVTHALVSTGLGTRIALLSATNDFIAFYANMLKEG